VQESRIAEVVRVVGTDIQVAGPRDLHLIEEEFHEDILASLRKRSVHPLAGASRECWPNELTQSIRSPSRQSVSKRHSHDISDRLNDATASIPI
jgi:hypothetical protein